jgi:hypothetical protein
VVHCKSGEPFDVYIGRGSPFGNPYSHKSGTQAQYVVANRVEAIACYERYFLDRLEKDAQFKRQVHALKGKVLACWCKPKACHGDVIIDYLKEV